MIDDKPKVAVCLAAFNGRQWLDEQIDTILAQADVDVTLFISVDRSTDGTEDLVDARACKDARIVVLTHGERFGGAARNFFRLLRDLDFTGFGYVGFSDQDDIWFPDKLSTATTVLRQTGADAYSSDVIAFWPSGRRLLIRKSQPQREADFLFEAAGPGCTYVMKAGLVRELQALLATRWADLHSVALHDWFSYAMARAKGYRWIIDAQARMLYRQHSSNQLGVNSGLKALKYRSTAILSGWAFSQSYLIASLVGLAEHTLVSRGIKGGRIGSLWLAFQAGRCRRRLRDRVYFVVSCFVVAMTGHRQ
jgi:rhamnosyltransferase